MAGEYHIDKPESWVKKINIKQQNEIPAKSISNGVYYKLIDKQVYKNENQIKKFKHYTTKIVNQEGIDCISQIYLSFDPSYETIILHDIIRTRNGISVSQLSTSDFTVFQREKNPDQRIYDGRKTLSIILKDIRVGDTVEYSYTVSGSNPVLSGNLYEMVRIGWTVPVEHLYFNLIINDKELVYFKQYNSNYPVHITESNQYKNYTIDQSNLLPVVYEESLPIWYDPTPAIQFSQSKDWNDVARFSKQLYSLHSGLSEDLKSKITNLISSTQSKSDYIVSALNFVQDEIRYLGLEIGAGSYKPTDPSIIYTRRFGDCKDKTWLFVEMMRSAGIESYPVLVDTYYRQTLSEKLPSPLVFNHVIAYLKFENQTG